jgi:hypothetical protein
LPRSSITAATWTSLCVSTPPMTIRCFCDILVSAFLRLMGDRTAGWDGGQDSHGAGQGSY